MLRDWLDYEIKWWIIDYSQVVLSLFSQFSGLNPHPPLNNFQREWTWNISLGFQQVVTLYYYQLYLFMMNLYWILWCSQNVSEYLKVLYFVPMRVSTQLIRHMLNRHHLYKRIDPIQSTTVWIVFPEWMPLA